MSDLSLGASWAYPFQQVLLTDYRPRLPVSMGVRPGVNRSAVIIQFSNDASEHKKNVGARVRAIVEYSYEGARSIRIGGAWLEQTSGVLDFRMDETHMLIGGVLAASGLYAI